MVKMHCFFIDKRLECIIGAWERRVDKRIIVVHDKFLKFFLTVYERTSAYITYDKAAGLLFSELQTAAITRYYLCVLSPVTKAVLQY